MNFRTDGDIRALLKGGVQKWQEKQNHSYNWKMAQIKHFDNLCTNGERYIFPPSLVVAYSEREKKYNADKL